MELIEPCWAPLTPSFIASASDSPFAEVGSPSFSSAMAVGVSRSAVAQWETGRAGQVTGNLTRIAACLEVGVEFLMHGEDKRAPMQATQGDELALLRLYRECAPEDRQLLLRTARRLALAREMPGDETG